MPEPSSNAKKGVKKAFPRPPVNAPFKDELSLGQSGMDLRDYFAAKALTALITRGTHDGNLPDLANRAFQIADVMMSVRGEV